jgi:lipoate-protein ligase A
MIYLTSITNPFLNLAVEEWLFRNSIHEFTLLLYRNAPSIVIGRNQNPWTEVNQSLLRMKRIPLVRRLSGGGTVYHDLGNTNYCVIMPKSKFTRSYSANLVCSALQQLDVPAIVNDRFDITLNGAKISGSAYRLSNNRSYHHGTMLIDTDLDSLSGLILPSRPSGIQGGGIDSVRVPVTRIAKTSYTVDHFTFCQAVQAEFKARFNQAHVTVIGPDVVSHPQVKQTFEKLMVRLTHIEHKLDIWSNSNIYSYCSNGQPKTHPYCRKGRYSDC